MKAAPLISEYYRPLTAVYPIKKPEIESGSTYYFTSGSGLKYQVTFGRKKNNYLENIINYSVISDEYEDEYSETNKGEVWKIISTMTEVIRIYHGKHPYSLSYEFSGEYKEGENNSGSSIRTRLFLRSIMRVLNFNYWDVTVKHNKVSVLRKKYND
jgi:hypothetical protein